MATIAHCVFLSSMRFSVIDMFITQIHLCNIFDKCDVLKYSLIYPHGYKYVGQNTKKNILPKNIKLQNHIRGMINSLNLTKTTIKDIFLYEMYTDPVLSKLTVAPVKLL